MSGKQKEIDEWLDEVVAIRKTGEDAQNLLRTLEHKLKSYIDKIPNDLSQLFQELAGKLEVIQNRCFQLGESYLSPTRKYFSGQRVTEQEFHLLLAQRILHWKGGGMNEYEKFVLLHYEGETQQGYINISSRPPEPPKKIGNKRVKTVGLSWGIAPEEVQIKYLRDEQTKYFKEHMPEIYARFKKQ